MVTCCENNRLFDELYQNTASIAPKKYFTDNSVVHTLELDRTGKSDEEQLAYAVKHKMALFTHNIKDYIVLSISYEKQKRKHYGIILSPQIPFNDLLTRSLKFLSSNSQETIKTG